MIAKLKKLLPGFAIAVGLLGGGWGTKEAYDFYKTANLYWQNFKVIQVYMSESPEFRAWATKRFQPKPPVTPETVVE